MAFLFSGLYEDIPNIDLYLERIEYQGDQQPTLDNLKELMWKHLTHIPYGNLDFYRNQNCPSLAISDIFEKIIINHGYGGCFEINLLFFALLKSMGYNFFPVIVKCLFGSPDPVVPTHCAAIVTIDNKRYYVDVGCGLASRVIEMAIAFAKDRHCYKVILQSGMTRMEAHQLYESKGFNRESKRAFDMRLD